MNLLASTASEDRIHYVILSALVPGIIFVTFVHLVLGWSVLDYTPNIYNDEVGYWRYISTFREVGFSGGYYSPNEVLATFEAIKFDAHGPVFPIIYGTLAKLTGWQPYSAFFINLALLSLALICFMRGMERGALLLICLLVISFWPIFLYLGTAFQETINDVAAILFALFFAQLISGKRNLKVILILFSLVFVFSLLRYSWAILYFPLLFYSQTRRSFRSSLSTILLAGFLALFTIWVFGLLTPSGSDVALEVFYRDYGSLSELARQLFSGALENSVKGVSRITNPKNPVDFFLFLQLIIFLLLISASLIRQKPDSGLRSHALFHFANLLPISIALMGLEGSFERVISGHLLLSFLIVGKLGARWILYVVICVNLVATPFLPRVFQDWWQPNYSANQQEFIVSKEKMANILHFEKNPPTPWCNTILVMLSDYDKRLLIIPAGFGISYVHQRIGTIDPFPKSKYVLGEKLALMYGNTNFKLLSNSPMGKLYVNNRSACEFTRTLNQ